MKRFDIIWTNFSLPEVTGHILQGENKVIEFSATKTEFKFSGDFVFGLREYSLTLNEYRSLHEKVELMVKPLFGENSFWIAEKSVEEKQFEKFWILLSTKKFLIWLGNEFDSWLNSKFELTDEQTAYRVKELKEQLHNWII